MAAPSHRTSRFVVALVVALAGLAIAASPARASHASPPPRLSALHMQWFRWHPPTRVASTTASVGFGSTAVLGLRSMRDLASLRATYGFAHVREIPSLRAAEVSVDEGQLRALLTQGPSDPRVRYVSPLGPERQATSMPNDPLLHALDAQTNLPTEWQFAASHVDRALDFTSGSPSIIVGTIDTGAAAVPDLTGKLDSLWSVTGTQISQSPPEGNDDYGHGTAVASLIAANVDDGFGMAGFGGTTHVIAVHAGNEGFFLDAPVAIALTKLVSLGARIVNMSIGGRTPSAPILVDAIHQAEANGVLLIAAAGNDNGNVGWPAADLQTSDGGRSYGLAVGATNVNGSRAAFSDWGRHLSLVAPGDYGGLCSGVLVALPAASLFDDSCFVTWTGDGGARYGNLEGTSFAAPEVAGIAALIWAARPELKNYQVADIIKQSARRSAPDWTRSWAAASSTPAPRSNWRPAAPPPRGPASTPTARAAPRPGLCLQPGRARSTRRSPSAHSGIERWAIRTSRSGRPRHPASRSPSPQPETAGSAVRRCTSPTPVHAWSLQLRRAMRTTTSRRASRGVSSSLLHGSSHSRRPADGARSSTFRSRWALPEVRSP